MPPLKHWIYSGVGICTQVNKYIVHCPDEHNGITIDSLHGPSACWEPGSLLGRENMELMFIGAPCTRFAFKQF